jgi:GNAT superfamily N-acetyltransferase
MSEYLQFSDVELSKRLERAEGTACVEFAEARQRVSPECGSEWIECGGAFAVFDGVDSPITQSFGLGLFEKLTVKTLDRIEAFFTQRGAQVMHEVSPLAGPEAMDLLCSRKYRPIEISSVLYRRVEKPNIAVHGDIKIQIAGADEAEIWSDVGARGWGHEHPEFIPFLKELGAVAAARKHSLCFLAEIEGKAGAAASLSIHEGVALLGGSSTVPELRRKGLHAALLEERLHYAFNHGCDLAMMVALAGSESQRNAERKGFRIAYTRMKWQLFA